MGIAISQICIPFCILKISRQTNSNASFMEGGDLHGIVSIKVLDVTKKTSVESAYVKTKPHTQVQWTDA